MSKVLVKYNRQTGIFEFTEDNLSPDYCDIVAELDTEGEVLIFHNLSFGSTVKNGDTILTDDSYPPEGVTYLSSDQPTIQSHRVFWEADMVIDIDVWMAQTGIRVEDSHQLTVPRPPQPYPSWSWNAETKAWEAPVPYPDDGKDYNWDEEDQKWVLVEYE